MYDRIDELLRSSRLDEAGEYMRQELAAAEERGDVPSQLYLLGELAGFSRDTGDTSAAVDYAERADRLFPQERHDSAEYTALLLNLANAYRAAAIQDKAHEVYDRISPLAKRYTEHLPAYHNNLALLLQDEGRFAEAADELRSALAILSDERKIAITQANLAVCLVHTGDVSAAEENARQSLLYFEGMSPSDFHYSAALAAMGDICTVKGDSKAAHYYEASLSEIELHMGKCGFYDIVLEKLMDACGGQRPKISGIELSRGYFDTFGRPMLKRNFPDISDRIAAGLAGEGSENFGFDDALSADHDFGPSFCIFVDDDVPQEIYDRLCAAYDALPPVYFGMRHTEGVNSAGRRGVMRTSAFYGRIIGDIPQSAEDFQLIRDEDLACATNGSIFFGGAQFADIRRKIKARPDADRFAKLSAEVESMSKHGEYNLLRMLKRGDITAASLSLSLYLASAMRAEHLIHGRFAPYQKWLHRSTRDISPELYTLTDEAVRSFPDSAAEYVEKINAHILKGLADAGLSDSTLPAAAAADLLELAQRANRAQKIIDIEWAMFDKVQNKGGRAACQDDYPTFSIMRKSQYYCFDTGLLDSILRDFTAARDIGRNVITEKYGYMMRYTVPEEFAQIEKSLPEISPVKASFIDAIVPIQTGWMEEFAAKYPRLASNARMIHSEEDMPSYASYETYLRGELATYSEETVAMYGAFIASIARSGGNLAEMTISRSVHMYGYASLEEAEMSQK